MDSLRFARQFLRHPKQLGTVVQSGRTLARKMADEVGESVQVVEFGAGTGPVTREILRRLPENGRLDLFRDQSGVLPVSRADRRSQAARRQ